MRSRKTCCAIDGAVFNFKRTTCPPELSSVADVYFVGEVACVELFIMLSIVEHFKNRHLGSIPALVNKICKEDRNEREGKKYTNVVENEYHHFEVKRECYINFFLTKVCPTRVKKKTRNLE